MPISSTYCVPRAVGTYAKPEPEDFKGASLASTDDETQLDPPEYVSQRTRRCLNPSHKVMDALTVEVCRVPSEAVEEGEG